jgi:hypothetical protein
MPVCIAQACRCAAFRPPLGPRVVPLVWRAAWHACHLHGAFQPQHRPRIARYPRVRVEAGTNMMHDAGVRGRLYGAQPWLQTGLLPGAAPGPSPLLHVCWARTRRQTGCLACYPLASTCAGGCARVGGPGAPTPFAKQIASGGLRLRKWDVKPGLSRHFQKILGSLAEPLPCTHLLVPGP